VFLVGSGLEYRGQCGEQQGGHPSKFRPVGDRQPQEQGVPAGSYFDQDFPVVQDAAVAAHQAEGGEPVNELDNGVMLELKLPG
jgi:hypothetical protein